ncbi:MAG: OmpA family protein [Planctomycetaceae bacterium]
MKTLQLCIATALLATSSGCCLFGGRSTNELAASQLHARELYAENQRLLSSQMQTQQMLASAESEKQMLLENLSNTDSQLQSANARVENLLAERGELTDRYARALTGTDPLLAGGIPGADLTPDGFIYDAGTGLNKFRQDILFDLGSDAIRAEAEPIIADFASTVNSGAALGMKILIVGHTDDQQIVRGETARKHPTNWHLSTDRADAVILELTKRGVSPERIASMGYGEFQPVEASVAETARQRNRRVELYIVPSDINTAKWDPVSAVR